MTPLILGLAGTVLSADEAAFLRAARPCGLIIFGRNIGDRDGLVRLVAEASEAAGTRLVLVDQEGGRVQRLRPPLARRLPAAARIGALFADDGEAGRRAAYLQGRLIAADLAPFGITMPCLPVADVPVPGAHDVIGDRAFAHDPAVVAVLAGACAAGVLAGGAVPVVKHVPGHGRATSDSHAGLPRVTASRALLEADLVPFRALADLPAAMTAHVVYAAIDPVRPATLSADVIRLVREDVGFGGLLMTDDIGMGALSAPPPETACAALAAGCDVVLYCNGSLTQMEAVAAAVPAMTAAGERRLAAAQPGTADGEPMDAMREEFAALIGKMGEVGLDPTRMAS